MRRLLAATIIVALTVGSLAQEYSGYSLDEASAFRNQWTQENWDDGGPLTRYVFLNMTEFWRHSVIDRAGPIRELPLALREDVASFITTTEQGELPLVEYVESSTVDGLIILHRGTIAFEGYPRMLAHDKHLYMSVSKGLVATVVAILEERQQIDVGDAIDSYLPELAGSGWAGVPVIDILDMASGIACLELEEGAYEDPETCYYHYEAALGWLRPTDKSMDSPHAYAASMQSHRPSGEAFEYTSPDTFVLGWLIERVTGKPVVEVLQQEIWQRMGAESDAVIAAPKRGVPIVHAGISSTLRDMARFGLLFTASGRAGENPLVSDSYLEKIQDGGRPEIFDAARQGDQRLVDDEAPLHNTYQWDFVMEDGDFFKGGYGGQGLYISPSRDLVVAFFGTMNADGRGHEATRIARQLAKSGMFER